MGSGGAHSLLSLSKLVASTAFMQYLRIKKFLYLDDKSSEDITINTCNKFVTVHQCIA